MAWKDTYGELGSELQAAKAAAIAAFMAAPADSAIDAAAAIPPTLSRQQRADLGLPLSSGDVAKVLTVTWRALARAHLTHIGPVSSDGSVQIGIVLDGNGVPQLDLRSAGGTTILIPGGPEVSSLLHPAYLPNALDLGEVYGTYTGYYTCTPTLFAGWTEGPDGTMVRNSVGALSPTYFDDISTGFGPDGRCVLEGKTFVAWRTGIGSSDKKLAGIYILDDFGAHYEGVSLIDTHAVLRRVPYLDSSSDYANGIAVYVQNGTIYGGNWMQVTIPDPFVLGTDEQEWAPVGSNPHTAGYALLSSAQLALASAEEKTATVTIDSGSGWAALSVSEFETLSGTPGVDAISAGEFFAWVKGMVSTAATGDTKLRVKVSKNDGMSVTELFSYETQALSATYSIKEITQNITTYSIAGCTLLLNIDASTTSATPVDVTVVVNDAARSTKISLPIELQSSIGDHRTLTHRDAPDQHPLSAIEPVGRLVLPFPSLAIAAGGKLTLGAANKFYVNPSGYDLGQISIPSDVDADETAEIELVFSGSLNLLHAQSPDPGFAALYLQDATAPGGPNIGFKHVYSSARILYIPAGFWLLVGYNRT